MTGRRLPVIVKLIGHFVGHIRTWKATLTPHGREPFDSTCGPRGSRRIVEPDYRGPPLRSSLRPVMPAVSIPSLRKVRRIKHWLRRRNSEYIIRRVFLIFRRYGLTTRRAKQRAFDCARLLSDYGSGPTFATPGAVVRKNAKFCRELHEMGVELAVHGYDHVDFTGLSKAEATRQFRRAGDAFSDAAVPFEGFRCPYLSCTPEVLDAVPKGMFSYSSNVAIWWEAGVGEVSREGTAIFDALRRFYAGSSSDDVISRPAISGGLVEIPASLPDDLQLYDGLKVGESGITDAWLAILRESHRRGELFAPLFHPETFEQCRSALRAVLHEATLLRPPVWITQLREIASWWRERSTFAAGMVTMGSMTRVEFECPERGTLLSRGLGGRAEARPWSVDYDILVDRTIMIANDTRPFVGVSTECAPKTIAFLEEEGFVVVQGDDPGLSAVFLDGDTLRKHATDVELLAYIDSSPGPLVRLWRWPDGARSALCVAGDLDALSLGDYLARVIGI
jgi:hypothetical protein